MLVFASNLVHKFSGTILVQELRGICIHETYYLTLLTTIGIEYECHLPQKVTSADYPLEQVVHGGSGVTWSEIKGGSGDVLSIYNFFG